MTVSECAAVGTAAGAAAVSENIHNKTCLGFLIHFSVSGSDGEYVTI